MFTNIENSKLFRTISFVVAVAFAFTSVITPSTANAQSVLNLPAPGTFVSMSPSYTPAIVVGITIYPDDPLQFDFIIDTGDDHLEGEALRKESKKLITYFMATLTVPEDEMWVNLSPYEENRIIANGLGDTILGRDMLAQDYILKQLTASMMYPEDEIGSEFWQRVYQKAQEKFGTTEIPTNTFNKIWIVPEKAVIYVNGTNIFVADSHLKVMMEEDYLALEHHDKGLDVHPDDMDFTNEAKAILKEVLLPEIEKEVNEGKNFAPLRQIYHSMILATWYKNNLKESLLGKVYVNQNKVEGVDVDDKEIKNKIYNRYVEAFKKGVYDYIKEDYDSETQQIIPRKYFSGGEDFALLAKNAMSDTDTISPDAWIQRRSQKKVRVEMQAQLNYTSSPVASDAATLAVDDLNSVREAINTIFTESQRSKLFKNGTVELFQGVAKTLIDEFDIDVTKDIQYQRLMNVTRQVVERGNEKWFVAQKVIKFLKEEARFNLKEQPWGRKSKLLTLVYGIGSGRKNLFDNFKDDLRTIQNIFQIADIKTLNDIEKQRILTAALYVARAQANPKKQLKRGIEYFKDTLTAISETFDIQPDEYKTLELQEKVRIMTAAYNVSLGKEQGLTAFKDTLTAISETFDIQPDEYKTLDLQEKVRIMTAAYAVSLGKEQGLTAFKDTLTAISETFDIQPDEYRKVCHINAMFTRAG